MVLNRNKCVHMPFATVFLKRPPTFTCHTAPWINRVSDFPIREERNFLGRPPPVAPNFPGNLLMHHGMGGPKVNTTIEFKLASSPFSSWSSIWNRRATGCINEALLQFLKVRSWTIAFSLLVDLEERKEKQQLWNPFSKPWPTRELSLHNERVFQHFGNHCWFKNSKRNCHGTALFTAERKILQRYVPFIHPWTRQKMSRTLDLVFT